MNKTFYALSWVGIISAIVLVLTSGFWLFYPYKVIDFKNKTFPIVNKTVKQGDFVKYISDYCKYLDIRPSVSRSFVNGLIFTTPMILTSRETGCHKMIVAISVPQELPIGTYHLEVNFKYKVNPLREMMIKVNSDKFEVVESTQSAELRLQGY